MTFKKGQSGNIKGRPTVPQDLRDAFKSHVPMALERLVYWAQSDNAHASVVASDKILDRAWGKATQMVSGDPDNPLQIVVKSLHDLIQSQDGLTKSVKK